MSSNDFGRNTGASFLALVESRAAAPDFMPWFHTFSQPVELSKEDWLELVPPVANAVIGLEWMEESDRRWVQGCILDFVQWAFTKLSNPRGLYSAEIKDPFTGFIAWLESQPDNKVVRFCWDLLSHDRRLRPEPILWLHHSRRLAGEISYENLHLAVSLVDEADAMFWRPDGRWSVVNWERDSQPYFRLLDHSSYLVRAASSNALGELFYGVQTNDVAGRVPLLSDLLAMIQDREIKTPGIAGGFLDGARWSIDEWSSFDNGFDMPTWFMETLSKSGQEPSVPHVQSLEFYSHEFFSRDPDAIREFLQMGRTKLAVLTATEEPYPLPAMLPVLNEMAASSDPAVSTAIREYLADPSHHAGLRHLRADGNAVD